MHIKNNTDIGIPKQIYNKKDLTIKVNSWSKENEKVWYIIKKYEKNITEIYKLIH
jgi:hypothetical protein